MLLKFCYFVCCGIGYLFYKLLFYRSVKRIVCCIMIMRVRRIVVLEEYCKYVVECVVEGIVFKFLDVN